MQNGKLKYFSMFSGIGGFELGIGDKAECIGFSEIDKYASELLKNKFPTIRNYGDARQINPRELPEFDMLCGGFPCQSFSMSGKRRGFEDTRGTLFFEIARILEVKKPKYIFLENVKGLLNHDEGKTFRVILQTISELGYDVEWMVISGGYYTQQDRQRVFIFGVHRGEDGTQRLGELGFLWQLDKRASKTLPTISTKPVGRGECVIIEAKGKRRWLTETECERLQGFPEGWTGGFSMTQRYKMLGNAVNVKVIQAIANRLWCRLEKESAQEVKK